VFFLAKVLQALGCADVGFALWVGVTHPAAMGKEFELATIGMVVFCVGYLTERWAAS
jgi:hypothetical protein